MKNITEGEKMVWAAVFAGFVKDGCGVTHAVGMADVQTCNMRHIDSFYGINDGALETAKEVLK